MTNHKQTDIQGHRGARGLYPENTITAFLEAVKLGVNTLEMDVVISKDSKVVVSHEAWMNEVFCTRPDGRKVEKNSKEKYNLYEMPYDEIKKFDCGIRGNNEFPFQKKISEHKPLLSEVFIKTEAYIKKNNFRDTFYNIEIKTEPGTEVVFNPEPKKFVELVHHEIMKYNLTHRCRIQSFDTMILEETRRISPKTEIGLLVENEEPLETNLAKLNFTPDTYSPYYQKVNSEMVQALKQRGIKIVPWTVNEIPEMKMMLGLNVDGIITDYPDRLINLIKQTN